MLQREWCIYRMFFLGRKFVSGLICTLKSKKPKNLKECKKKNKKLYPKNLGFFPALVSITADNGQQLIEKCRRCERSINRSIADFLKCQARLANVQEGQ